MKNCPQVYIRLYYFSVSLFLNDKRKFQISNLLLLSFIFKQAKKFEKNKMQLNSGSKLQLTKNIIILSITLNSTLSLTI